jgi:hypothetical protein
VSPDVGDRRLALRALVTGAFQAQCLRVAAELGLAGHLAAGPVTSAGLADACGANEPALRRVLRTLVAIGLLDRDDRERYALTPLGTELDGLAAWVSYSTSAVLDRRGGASEQLAGVRPVRLIITA